MDWRKTKTIFIITFLILNFFLGYQIYKKRENSNYDIITEAPIEEQFEADEIKYGELPKEPARESYISGKSYIFSEEDIETLREKDQNVDLIQDTILQSSWKEPFQVPDAMSTARLNQLIKDQVLFGDQYEYWGFNLENNTFIFYQKYNGELIYHNENGKLILFLNKENQITSYQQTFIDEMEPMDEEQEIIQPLKALEYLYNRSELKPGSTVTNVKLGYFTLVTFTNTHVLTPTWHIVVNDEQDFFVNAFEGQIIRMESNIVE